MRRTLLTLLVAASLTVPASFAVLLARDARRAGHALTEASALLDASIERHPELSELPTRVVRARLAQARDGAADEPTIRRARALAAVCDGIDALARGELSSASQSADAALRLSPDEPLALLVQAAAAAGRGERGAAERSVERLQRLSATSPLLRARAALMRAEWLLDAGRAHEALEVAEALDRAHPGVGPALNVLGLARGAVGDREGALRAFEAAVDRHPRREIPLLNLARAQREQGQLTLARATLERALGLAPDYPDAWVLYGVVLADLRAPNARHVLVRAAQLAPTDATPLAAQGALDLADGQHEQAAESFRQALAREPDHAIARANLGVALARLGRNDLALRAFEQAAQRAPHLGEAWNGLGSMRLAAGQLEGAVAALRQAMTLLPEDPNPAINLGRALEGLQQWDAAARAYREALRRQPTHRAAAERLLALTPPDERDRLRARMGLARSAPNEDRPHRRSSRTLASWRSPS